MRERRVGAADLTSFLIRWKSQQKATHSKSVLGPAASEGCALNSSHATAAAEIVYREGNEAERDHRQEDPRQKLGWRKEAAPHLGLDQRAQQLQTHTRSNPKRNGKSLRLFAQAAEFNVD